MKVIVRDGFIAVGEYADTIGHASADSGGLTVALPAGMAALEYDADSGVLRLFDAKGNAYPREGAGPHAECDALIAALPSMLAAKAARLTPPPPTAEQLERAARIATDGDELLQAKLDGALMALVDATPEQLINYARNNFPSLTLAEQNKMGAVLHLLAVAVRPRVR